MREDWIECKIKDVGEITSGGTPSTSVSEYWDGEISWISPSDLTGYKEKFISKGKKSITLSGLNKSSARLIPAGSVLFSSRAPIGYVVIAKNELATNQGFKNVSPSKIVDTDFLYHFLKNSKQVAEKVATGTTFKEISKDAFGKLTFPLPPLPEQRAIVKKLESLFSSLDAGVADLKKAQQQLKIYRQAVLKKAFEGELTNIKIENLVSIDQNAIVNPRPPKEGFDDEFECQFVPMKLVEALNNKIHLEESAVFNTLKGKSYTYFETGDVIFAKVTPCMENGKIAVAKDLKNGVALGSSEFHVFRCNDELLNEYLFYFIIQDKFRSDAERAMTGAVGLRRVPKKFIEDYEIPLPSIAEQKAIVKQIESRLSVCDSIEQNIKESLEKAEALRQSILKKAFEGNLLTAQELAECKLAEDYEPASVLLERIKAEQKKAVKPKTIKKTIAKK